MIPPPVASEGSLQEDAAKLSVMAVFHPPNFLLLNSNIRHRTVGGQCTWGGKLSLSILRNIFQS